MEVSFDILPGLPCPLLTNFGVEDAPIGGLLVLGGRLQCPFRQMHIDILKDSFHARQSILGSIEHIRVMETAEETKKDNRLLERKLTGEHM